MTWAKSTVFCQVWTCTAYWGGGGDWFGKGSAASTNWFLLLPVHLHVTACCSSGVFCSPHTTMKLNFCIFYLFFLVSFLQRSSHNRKCVYFIMAWCSSCPMFPVLHVFKSIGSMRFFLLDFFIKVHFLLYLRNLLISTSVRKQINFYCLLHLWLNWWKYRQTLRLILNNSLWVNYICN